jgi:hypothetical protein
MSTLRWFAATAALAGAAIGLWWQTRAPEPPAITAVASPMQPQPRHASSYPAASPLLASPPPRETAAASAATDNGSQLMARFASERIDAAWASETRSQLETDLGKVSGADASVRTVECRTSICRVEVAVANNDAGAMFVQSWLRGRTFDGPGYVTQADGAMVMYLGRPGTELLSP